MEVVPVPCEERVLEERQPQSLTIGLLREVDADETRVALTPQGVAVLVGAGHRVLVERGAGRLSLFDDEEYHAAGAVLLEDAEMVAQAEVLVRLAPPRKEEVTMLPEGKLLVTCVGRHFRSSCDWRAALDKELNVLAIDAVNDGQGRVAVRCLGELEGMVALGEAGRLLLQPGGGKGILLGGITGVPPTELLILGSGATSVSAVRAANAVGCEVKVFDTEHVRLQELQLMLSQRIFTSTLHPQALDKALRSADVLLLTRRRTAEGHNAFQLTADHVALLKRGAVVMDLDIVAGGRCEVSRPTTLANPVYREGGVVFHALPDITCLAPHTASIVLSDIVTPLLLSLAREGGLELAARYNKLLRSAVAVYHGTATNDNVADSAGVQKYDIRLLLA